MRPQNPDWSPKHWQGPYRLSIRLVMLASESSPCLLHSCRSRLMQLQLEERERKKKESVSPRDGVPTALAGTRGRGGKAAVPDLPATPKGQDRARQSFESQAWSLPDTVRTAELSSCLCSQPSEGAAGLEAAPDITKHQRRVNQLSDTRCLAHLAAPQPREEGGRAAMEPFVFY